ncbi:MAG: hypothetical protein FJ267_05095 [Planctomycetes bacterium]|nr:hypothetical protein [Planctomycetota bacterium]
MKHIHNYVDILFALLLISSLTVGLIDRDIGMIGFIIVATGWATTQIVRNAIASLVIVFFDEE